MSLVAALTTLLGLLPGATSPGYPLAGTTANPSGTLFGAVVARRGTETFAQAQQRADSKLGRLDISRIFYPGAPEPWPGKAGFSGRPVVVSFNYSPGAVLAGTYDRQLRAWFATAPTDRAIYWSYLHEPEDDIARGEFTAARYREAWAHISALAASAGNPRLHPTLILMCWSLNPASGRYWRNYYAGPTAVKFVAFDCFNWAVRDGRYADPAVMFERVVNFGRNTGIRWGIAELGSKKLGWDTNGSARATWLRKVGRFLAGKATFVTYFDTKLYAEYRLLDASSQAGWREVVTTY